MNLTRSIRPWSWWGAWSLALGASAARLEVEILPRFEGAPLVFDSLTYCTAAGQVISVTRLDFLVSNFALQRSGGSWLVLSDKQAYLSAREGRCQFVLPNIPIGRYERVRFLVGLTRDVNRREPSQYGADHPLNPNVNGLHWGWQGGYVFLALEGDWRDGATDRGYSFHVANEPQLMTVELPAPIEVTSAHLLRFTLDIGHIFAAPHCITLAQNSSTSHSRTNDILAAQLRENIEQAFAIESIAPTHLSETNPAPAAPLVASNATPYRFVIPGFFPRPALPLDNPLTEQGVALGRLLFHDTRLSVNNRQSCQSCHDLAIAGADRRGAVSTGAEGQLGTRNAMPLFNLAWRSSFFWDGRAATLREQVLQPIQNPDEMHETLANVVAKLRRGQGRAAPNYPILFTGAFGTPDITADRIARALEQFLLNQTSHDSKFDRVLNGEATFTEAEQRGFELFHTEYDPRRRQLGADCFHCHGGPLFQSQSFANNGLDVQFADPGRYLATHREGDRGKFSVPSLRNVEVTAPYMHDGRFTTLEQVIEHYTSGVKPSPTLDPNLAKHPNGGVLLNTVDQKALVAFLKTLTDEKYRPHTADQLADFKSIP